MVWEDGMRIDGWFYMHVATILHAPLHQRQSMLHHQKNFSFTL